MPRPWVLLLYKVPSEPSASRVYVWRKLKRLGAVLLHDAVWVLPASARSVEQLQWLAAEIVELKGEAWVWEAQLALVAQEEQLRRQFLAQVEAPYREILSALALPEADLAALARRYQQVQAQDHCGSPLGETVRAALLAAREGEAS